MFSFEALKDIVVKHLKGLADNQWNSSSMSFSTVEREREWGSERQYKTLTHWYMLLYSHTYVYKCV